MAPFTSKGRNQLILSTRLEKVKRQLRARSIKADKRKWTENIADEAEEAAKSQHKSTHPDLGGISALVSQTSFDGETSRNVAKYNVGCFLRLSGFFTKRRDSRITETAKYELNVLGGRDYAKQLNNSKWPQDYAEKMNSHVVLIMRSSMFNCSRRP